MVLIYKIAQCHHKELAYNDRFINIAHQRPTFDVGQEKELDLRGAPFNEFVIDQPKLLCPKQLTFVFFQSFFSPVFLRPFGEVVRRRPLFLSTSPVFAQTVSVPPLSPPLKSLSAQPLA